MSQQHSWRYMCKFATWLDHLNRYQIKKNFHEIWIMSSENFGETSPKRVGEVIGDCTWFNRYLIDHTWWPNYVYGWALKKRNSTTNRHVSCWKLLGLQSWYPIIEPSHWLIWRMGTQTQSSGGCYSIKIWSTSKGVPHINVRLSHDCLIFIMGIPIPGNRTPMSCSDLTKIRGYHNIIPGKRR